MVSDGSKQTQQLFLRPTPPASACCRWTRHHSSRPHPAPAQLTARVRPHTNDDCHPQHPLPHRLAPPLTSRHLAGGNFDGCCGAATDGENAKTVAVAAEAPTVVMLLTMMIVTVWVAATKMKAKTDTMMACACLTCLCLRSRRQRRRRNMSRLVAPIRNMEHGKWPQQ